MKKDANYELLIIMVLLVFLGTIFFLSLRTRERFIKSRNKINTTQVIQPQIIELSADEVIPYLEKNRR